MIPVALLFGLMGIIIFIMAISTNPAFLLISFALICYVIYCITSLQFMFKVLLRKSTVSTKLKDWIKVNAYGTSFIAIMFILSAVQSFSTSDILLRQQLGELIETQPQLAGQITVDVLFTMFKGVSAFLFIVGVISVTHVVLGFRLMKDNAAKFVD